jgi:hypothetical protein
VGGVAGAPCSPELASSRRVCPGHGAPPTPLRLCRVCIMAGTHGAALSAHPRLQLVRALPDGARSLISRLGRALRRFEGHVMPCATWIFFLTHFSTLQHTDPQQRQMEAAPAKPCSSSAPARSRSPAGCCNGLTWTWSGLLAPIYFSALGAPRSLQLLRTAPPTSAQPSPRRRCR